MSLPHKCKCGICRRSGDIGWLDPANEKSRAYDIEAAESLQQQENEELKRRVEDLEAENAELRRRAELLGLPSDPCDSLEALEDEAQRVRYWLEQEQKG